MEADRQGQRGSEREHSKTGCTVNKLPLRLIDRNYNLRTNDIMGICNRPHMTKISKIPKFDIFPAGREPILLLKTRGG